MTSDREREMARQTVESFRSFFDVTDAEAQEITLYKLGQIMDGDLGDVIQGLQAAQAADQLAQLEEGRA